MSEPKIHLNLTSSRKKTLMPCVGSAAVNFNGAGTVLESGPVSKVALLNSRFTGNKADLVPTEAKWVSLTQVMPMLVVTTTYCNSTTQYQAILSIRACEFDGITPIVAHKAADKQYNVYVDNPEEFNVRENQVNDDCHLDCVPGKAQDYASIPEYARLLGSSDQRWQNILQVRYLYSISRSIS